MMQMPDGRIVSGIKQLVEEAYGGPIHFVGPFDGGNWKNTIESLLGKGIDWSRFPEVA